MSAASASRIKLCYVCEATAGGVRKHLRELLTAFARPEEPFELHALLGDRGEPGFTVELERLRALGVRAEVLPDLRREIGWTHDRAAYVALKSRLAAIAPQIVHTHGSKAGFLGRLAAHAVSVPHIIHTPHVFPFQWTTGLRRAFYLRLERYAARRCHKVVCVGPSQHAEALRVRVADPAQLTVIVNGVDAPPPAQPEQVRALRDRLRLAPQAEVVGMVARLAPQKGVGHFLEAAAQVLRARPQTIFVLAGGGPLEHEIRTRAAALGLDRERMRILGHVEAAEDLYPAFDVLVLSSLYEGLPYVLLEAMARGVPVVATAVQGSRDAVEDGVTGLLAKPGDIQALGDQMLRLLADAALRQRIGATALDRVRQHFSRSRFIDAHCQLYLQT